MSKMAVNDMILRQTPPITGKIHPMINSYPKPEIMSPAGHWPQLDAAIEAGADSVYFGLRTFTARAKVGFDLDELPHVMRTLHARGVKGYVTFNTLVFDTELDEATRTIAHIAEANADSIIVQDVGIAQLAKQIAPDLDVHGSTQMSVTSAEGVALAQQFGASRVVLGRELALTDIAQIRGQTDCELEMFVHGALCVSYSGQCFSSEAWGGRSANRGKCAQACRLPYKLLVDDVIKPLGDARYLLSPGDLYALRQIPEIIPLGISALKIEGRYKNAEYVALTTQAYRQAVDEAWAGRALSITPQQELQLEQIYSRGLAPHFVAGVNHQTVVDGRAPRHRGVLIGTVAAIRGPQVIVQPQAAERVEPLKAGDGVVFDAAEWRSPEQKEEGGHIYHVTHQKNGEVLIEFGNNAIDLDRVRVGDLIWRTHDAGLNKIVRHLTHAEQPVRKQDVSVHVVAHEGQPLLLEWTLTDKPSIQVIIESADPLRAADNRPIDITYARKQLGRLGASAYSLGKLTLDMRGSPFAPSSMLNELRRQAVDELAAQQVAGFAGKIHDPVEVLGKNLRFTNDDLRPAADSQQPALHLLVRTPEQLDAAIELRPATITLDYLDLYGLRPAVEKVREQGITVRVASPRVLKPDEQRIGNFLLRLDAQILVRSGGLLHAFQAQDHPPLIGDFSLNAANLVSADLFLQLGLDRITPTHDLNGQQVVELARAIKPTHIEVVAYQHLPVFHTEHCVFCRFLSDGTSYKDCGKPCEEHKVALRDVQGRAHPVMADVGCRNTVFGAEAQTADQHLDSWLAAGIVDYRLEFVHESADEVTRVTQAFDAALAGRISSRELGAALKQIAPQGVTEGSLFVSENEFVLTPIGTN